MTLPVEELHSLKITRDFLLELSSGEEKRIPSAARKRARDCLRHYPFPVSIEARYPEVTDNE